MEDETGTLKLRLYMGLIQVETATYYMFLGVINKGEFMIIKTIDYKAMQIKWDDTLITQLVSNEQL